MSESHQADGYNAGYADQLYERRLRDRGIVPPSLLDPDLNGFGAGAVVESTRPAGAEAPVSTDLLHTAMAAGALVEDFRTHGHLLVPVDPLGSEPPGHPSFNTAIPAM